MTKDIGDGRINGLNELFSGPAVENNGVSIFSVSFRMN
jgi:hypothetical protein